MNLFSQWVEVLITQDSGRFANVGVLLRNAGVAYKEKIQNIGHSNRRHGQLGSLGESTNYSNIYQIYVRKKDEERAKAVISRR